MRQALEAQRPDGCPPRSIRRHAPVGADAKVGKTVAAAFDLNGYLHQRALLVERALEGVLKAPREGGSRLVEAMRYSLFAGGKRLRPIVALAACEAVGGATEAALGLACALEMIHTYSMIHDDLPCMDDDDFRRGKPSSHKAFGEALAVLAGDALLTDAFGVAVRLSLGAEGRSAQALLQVIAELSAAAGSAGMVEGQALDLQGEGLPMSLAELQQVHRRKTGALFVAAACGGARLGGASERQLSAFDEYAQSLGLAFQVTDDLLDVEGNLADLGKRTNKDKARGKNTYAALIGVGQAHAEALRLADRACQALAGFDRRADPLRELARFAVERRK